MKGKLVPVGVNPLNPGSILVRKYTDASDQDWTLAPDKAFTNGNIIATPSADAAHYYSIPTDYKAAAGEDYDTVANLVDDWVDQWASGANPTPRIAVAATASKPKGGGGFLALVVLALLVLSDKKRR